MRKLQQFEEDRLEIERLRASRSRAMEETPTQATARVAQEAAARLLEGRRGNEVGAQNEERLLNAVETVKRLGAWDLPNGRAWVQSARRTVRNSAEDLSGIDIVVETDIGPVFLQSKSSLSAAKHFRRTHRHMLVTCVIATDDDSLLIDRTAIALDLVREMKLSRSR